MQSLKDHFKKGVSWNALSVFGSAGMQGLTALILAYLMSVTEAGRVGILMVLMGQAFVVSEFGLAAAIVQAKEVRPVQINTVFVINLIVGFLLTVLFCLASPLAARFFRCPEITPVMLLTSVTFLILSTGLIHKARLTRDVNFFALSMAELSSYVVFVSVFALLAWRKQGIWAFAWAKVAQQTTETSILWIAGRYTPNLFNISFRETRSMFHFGMNMTGAQVVAFLIGNLDTLLVGRYYSPLQIGYYTYAKNLVITPAVRFLKLITRVGTPILSKMQDDLPRMARSYSLMTKLLGLLALPAFIGLSSTAREIIWVSLPHSWLPVVPIIQIQSLSMLAHLFAALTIVVYYSLGRANILMRFQIFVLIFRAALFGVVVCFFTHNVIYISWALLFERLFFMILFERLAFRLMMAKATVLFRYLSKPLIGSALMAAAVFAISTMGGLSEHTRTFTAFLLTLEIVVGAIVYVTFVALTDRHVVGEFKALVSARRNKSEASS